MKWMVLEGGDSLLNLDAIARVYISESRSGVEVVAEKLDGGTIVLQKFTTLQEARDYLKAFTKQITGGEKSKNKTS